MFFLDEKGWKRAIEADQPQMAEQGRRAAKNQVLTRAVIFRTAADPASCYSCIDCST
jgi:hypothetical protein